MADSNARSISPLRGQLKLQRNNRPRHRVQIVGLYHRSFFSLFYVNAGQLRCNIFNTYLDNLVTVTLVSASQRFLTEFYLYLEVSPWCANFECHPQVHFWRKPLQNLVLLLDDLDNLDVQFSSNPNAFQFKFSKTASE